jgi:hypothetical protein
MSRAEFIEVLKAEEDYRQGKITEEEITRLVKIGKLTPSEYKMIVGKCFSMYKDVRRDLLMD